MACCIIGLLILAGIARIRRLLGITEPEPIVFAPVARRPAAGAELPEAAVAAVAPPAPRRPAGNVALRYAALGVALWLAATPVLLWSGLVVDTGSTGSWLVRTGSYLIAAAIALMISRSLPDWGVPAGVATLLIITGAVIFELSVFDMHVFAVVHPDHANHLGDMLFHGIGPALALAGAIVGLYGLAGRTITSRRSSRSTVTRALPEESAVTVSSTPPVTT